MSWAVLIASGVLESVWAIALDKSEGFSHPLPTVVFVVALVGSMVGLSHAVRDIPLGVAYSVWVGVGATLTFAYTVTLGGAHTTPLQVAFACGLVACIVGLKLASA